jgi:hypothetical protein
MTGYAEVISKPDAPLLPACRKSTQNSVFHFPQPRSEELPTIQELASTQYKRVYQDLRLVLRPSIDRIKKKVASAPKHSMARAMSEADEKVGGCLAKSSLRIFGAKSING